MLTPAVIACIVTMFAVLLTIPPAITLTKAQFTAIILVWTLVFVSGLNINLIFHLGLP